MRSVRQVAPKLAHRDEKSAGVPGPEPVVIGEVERLKPECRASCSSAASTTWRSSSLTGGVASDTTVSWPRRLRLGKDRHNEAKIRSAAENGPDPHPRRCRLQRHHVASDDSFEQVRRAGVAMISDWLRSHWRTGDNTSAAASATHGRLPDVDYYGGVLVGAETIGALALSESTHDEVRNVLALLDRDDYSDYVATFVDAGRRRAGAAWQYADIVTVLAAATRLVSPRTYLEIGVRRGRSLAVVAGAAPEASLIGVDMSVFRGMRGSRIQDRRSSGSNWSASATTGHSSCSRGTATGCSRASSPSSRP